MWTLELWHEPQAALQLSQQHNLHCQVLDNGNILQTVTLAEFMKKEAVTKTTKVVSANLCAEATCSNSQKKLHKKHLK